MSKDIKCPECKALLNFHDLMPDQVKNDLRKNLENITIHNFRNCIR